MKELRENIWAIGAIVVYVGLCIWLGLLVGSPWAPLLVLAGAFFAYWGSAEGINENQGRFLLFSILGVGLLGTAVWLAGFAGRWLWTPIWLFVCLAPFVGAVELGKNDFRFAAAVGNILGFAGLIFSIAGPWLLYKWISGSAVEIGFKPDLPGKLEWWMLGLLLGLVCAWLANRQADAWNPGRFSLLAFGAVVLLGWATYASNVTGRWWWIVPWLIAAGLIYAGAKDVGRYRDWSGTIGTILAVLSVAVALAAPLWLYNLLPLTSEKTEVAQPAVTLATQTPQPTDTPKPAPTAEPTAPAVESTQRSASLEFARQFAKKSITSIWGFLHLLVLGLLGELWIRRWGSLLFVAGLFAAAWYFGGATPASQSAWLAWISSSPVYWLQQIMAWSIGRWDTIGPGIILTGLALPVLLFPATRLTFRANQTLQQAAGLKNILGSTAALRYMDLKGVSQGRIILATFTNLGLQMGLSISLWLALRALANSGKFPASSLGFLFNPNLTVPSFKPVLQWQYFAWAGIFWVLFMIAIAIQQRYVKSSVYGGCQNPLVSLIASLASALLVPAGLLLFSSIQFVAQWATTPLSFLGASMPAKRVPRPAPQPEPRPEPWPEPEPEPEPEPPPISEPKEPAWATQMQVEAIISEPSEPEQLGEEVLEFQETLNSFTVNDQGQIVLLANNGELSLYDNGRQTEKIRLNLSAPAGLIGAARGELVAIGRNGKLVVLQLSDSKFQTLREGALSIPVRNYAVNPFGSLLVCCHPDISKVSGVFLARMEEKLFSDQIENPTALSFSPDGRYLAIGNEIGAVQVIDIATRQPAWSFDVSATDLEGPVLHLAGIKQEGQPCWMVVYGNEIVALWSLDGKYIDEMELSFSPVCLATSPDQERFAVGGEDGQLEVYSADFDLELEGQAHQGKLTQLLFDKSSGQLYTAGKDNILKVISI
ncbi:MAG: hypothetical protein MUE67_08805 [Anaerolineales bacterium]|jgi:hypothetical protein|nr:hypothetical protein [Anaerolineales bacterium]